MTAIEELLSRALDDPCNAWSLGTFGAIAEFRRDADEPVERSRQPGWERWITSRGGIGVRTHRDALPVAYRTLSSDGETWGHALAFCLPRSSEGRHQTVVCLGQDEEALQKDPSPGLLFDLGVGSGLVSFCVRTSDKGLIGALRALEDEPLFGPSGAEARALLARMSPPRVALSPLGRIEVYAPIPAHGEKSPTGPHTHLLPKLLRAGRAQSANVPIPEGLQSALTLHPHSPWRDALGVRTPFDPRADEAFQALLERFGLPEDKGVHAAVEAAVVDGADPVRYPWPATRRARAQARITLRQLGQRLGADRLAPWRTRYDRGAATEEVSEV